MLTDLPETLTLTKENVELNKSSWTAREGSCEVQILNWEDNVGIDFNPDIIILADCVYYEAVWNSILLIGFFMVKNIQLISSPCYHS